MLLRPPSSFLRSLPTQLYQPHSNPILLRVVLALPLLLFALLCDLVQAMQKMADPLKSLDSICTFQVKQVGRTGDAILYGVSCRRSAAGSERSAGPRVVAVRCHGHKIARCVCV